MEAFLVVLVLILIAAPVIALISAFTTGRELKKRVTLLEREVIKLRGALAAGIAPGAETAEAGHASRTMAATDTSAAASPRPAPRPSAPTIVPARTEPQVAGPRTAGEQLPGPFTPQEMPLQPAPDKAPAPAPNKRKQKPAKPSRTSAEWEALLGGRVLNRIGAVALIIGMGFFLKYAFDKEWITEEMRTGIGAVFGVGLLLLGARSHKKNYAVFGQGLIGAGLSVLYLTVFAAFSLYDIGLSQIAAFLLMSGITALAFQQAFRYNSLAVSLLGLIGGFLTPIMLSTGTVNEVGLFSYLAIMNAGLIAITLVGRRWKILEPLAFICTHLYYFIWLSTDFDAPKAGTAALFLGIFWAIFQIPDILRALKEKSGDREFAALVGTANAGVLLIGMMIIIPANNAVPIATAPAIIGCVYLAMTAILRRGTHGDAFIANRNALIGITALTIAAWQHHFYPGHELYRPLIMTSLALGLFWWGAHRRAVAIWLPSLIVFGNALLAAYAIRKGEPALVVLFVPLLPTMIAQFMVVAGLMLALIPARLIDDGAKRKVGSVLHYAWAAVLLAALSLLTSHTFLWHATPSVFVNRWSWFSLSTQSKAHGFSFEMIRCIVWLGYGLLLTAIALWTRRRPILHVGLISIVMAAVVTVVVGSAYVPSIEFVPILNLRAAAMLAIIAGLAMLSAWLRKYQDHHTLPQPVAGIIQTVAVLIVLEFLTVEAADIFNQAIVTTRVAAVNSGISVQGTVDALRSRQQLTISGIWIIYSALLMVLGILRRARPLRVIAFVLFGLTIVKIFVFDLSFLDTLYRIFSFIGLGVILLGISFLFQRFRDVIFGTDGSAEPAENADDKMTEPETAGTGI